MFERRLKIVLGILSAVVLLLIGRAAQLQVAQGEYWHKEANDALTKVTYTETNRGKIEDRTGIILAKDRPCTDACVMYAALPYQADPKWLASQALTRLKARMGDAWSKTPVARRKELKAAEMQAVQKELDAMWGKLAKLAGKTPEEIEQVRQSIIQRVDIRKKYVWYHSYLRALKKQGGGDDSEPKWQKWLSGESDDGPQIDQFVVSVSEEIEPHVILRDISMDVQNELRRHPEEYPGLVLRPGLARFYPYDDVACHILGHLGKVNREDLLADANRGNPQRQYLPNDDIGRAGIEWLCEPALRGSMGRITSQWGDDTGGKVEPPTPGQDVRISIDVGLQQDIQNFFAHATLRDSRGQISERDTVIHGAAIVLDVKTNQVLAMVSFPTYDLNHLDEDYSKLLWNKLDDPLRDRATESQLEPGSTVKPLVGLSGITEGVVKVNEGIECTGFLQLPDHHGGIRRYTTLGRCWVASSFFQELNGNVAHHPVPFSDPHRGHDGNKDGWLTYSDGLERSCNVYFETVADRLGMDRLSAWMRRFGLGRRTGIGIEEFTGHVPADAPPSFGIPRRPRCFLGGIGQGFMAATPIQMANIASTIARGGIWMRPQLILPDKDSGKMPALHPGAIDGPDRVDLHLNPEALAACKLGMIEVVNAMGGTGKGAHMDDLLVAGKTGTAQGAALRIAERDPLTHKILRDEHNNPIYMKLDPSTPEHPNPIAPWYRGAGKNNEKPDHAWMIGFAPADDPKVAFAVLVEYGGSGGLAAADVVRASLDACIAHGYLQSRPHSGQWTPPPLVAQAMALHHDDED